MAVLQLLDAHVQAGRSYRRIVYIWETSCATGLRSHLGSFSDDIPTLQRSVELLAELPRHLSITMVLHQYDYIFAIGTLFAMLDAYNNGASAFLNIQLHHPFIE